MDKKEFFLEDDIIKDRLRKSKPHLVILYDQMGRLDKFAEKSENILEQIEITNTMMNIVKVISDSIN